MTETSPDVVLNALTTLAAGYVMVVFGLRKKQLRWNEPRTCPSCRHPRRDCICIR
jgi:hypothetical protein